jgi:phosphoenolpyruvate synthase/pyruvate phosphate dikinase
VRRRDDRGRAFEARTSRERRLNVTTTTAGPLSTAARIGIRPIAELHRGDVAFAGGKGANLGELTSAGLPVPPGFVVGAPAYAAFVSRTGLRERLESRLDGLDVDDAAALEAAARDCRRMIEAEPVPGDIAAAIRSSYQELAGPDADAPVACARRPPPRTPRRRPSPA